MKLRLTVVFLAAALLLCWGCGGNSDETPQSRIHGTWIIDIEKTAASSESVKEMLGDAPEAMEMLKASLGSAFINIDTDKGLMSGNMFGGEIPQTKFTVLSGEGNVVRIKKEDGQETEITIIDANSIAFRDPGYMDLVLVRKQ